ncbi:MAG TPA: Rrf2 family transcriptional regulator [Pyrinomonadaceae bacterium]|jgi:Rrf2 family protein|nr:Rrf2 family transcriptional regulator [Pyrinomonadaceae bacterium]
MKVSAQEEYGLRCLLQLARLSEGESLTLAQVAEGEGISQANAGKVLWLLNKAGLVASTRGTKGGYALARPAAEIRLSEVIKVLDEGEVEGHCKTYPGVLDSCVHTGDCGIRSVIVNVHEVVERALSGISLAQLAGQGGASPATLHKIQGLRGGAPGEGARG